ncbi:choloylglycine hydrolase [Eubacterium callanderi]|uniref:choloylglycine hydrolase n=1 Tax=Eubacterium callanderi TaxID=53442 RepID=UPI001D0925B9|nr:choloylglycine hydrolase [Eubacterium callanderi]MCB6659570.1 choloylglycine hydrolase [Eubacterium callanderi]MCB6752241.1 choloylglycine hydrolase [Eubacterium callanderi]MCB7103932.1 choloylglycine hydrolase [Eubacterium callanderi]MCG4819553.1 choloylglycine hydrolase [Eubacterium callanderi]MCQ5189832.1 choloylglycine hydrolase [Eubacterium callanderi]
MCTAATYTTKDHYFGRNLDLEFSYNETVTVTPRNYPFQFRKVKALESHYAMIGMAFVVDNYPLYYDATNEKGLSMAGLNFPENADYKQETEGKDNVTPFEFIPWILGQCSTIKEVKELLGRINLININFSEKLPLSPLHWMISDRNESITVESVKEGMKIYDNPVGILTNNPTFDIQIFNLNNYVNVTREIAENRFSSAIALDVYSRGMGGIGIPGDLSSSSRFVKAAFTKLNSVSGTSESESISQFFHILGSVNQERGCVRLAEDRYEITIYSSCCNVDKGVYYYKTYENSQITGVDMHNENLDSQSIVSYPLIKEQQIKIQN